MSGKDVVTSIVRTLVPFLVALVGPWLTDQLGLTDDEISSVSAIATGAAYYLLARLLEQFHPKLGFLLGAPKQPVYGTDTTLGVAGTRGYVAD
jgi:hypothetical protein